MDDQGASKSAPGASRSRDLWRALEDDQRAVLLRAVEAAAAVGGSAYLVGGPVRDLLRGEIRLRDLDITTTGDGRAMAEAFARLTGGVIVQRTDFGTATVRLPHPLTELDFATTRTETYAAPGALPTVTFPASIADDLRRRDFTINAMALPLTPDGFGPLIAASHAVEDLRVGRIRALHDASFRDDPTRLFRAIRYAARYGFTLEAQTAELCAAALAARMLDAISPARKRREIELGMRETNGVGCLAAFAAHGLLAATSPALVWDAWVATNMRRVLPLVGPHEWETRGVAALWPAWACFVCRQGEAAAMQLFADLGPFPAPTERDIRRVVRLWQARHTITSETRLSALAGFVDGLPEDAVLALFAGEPQASRLAAYYRRAAEITAENRREHHFDGSDLVPFNLPPDARRRRVLDAVRDARFDGKIHTFPDEIAFAKRYIRAHGLGM